MSFRSWIAAVALSGLLGVPLGLSAQQGKGPGLRDILQRVQANLDRYDARVPSFFCEEHVVSSHSEPGERDWNRVTDSIFRLKRTTGPDDANALVESREIQRVDGRAAASQTMGGPTMLSGAFEGGLAVVSQNQMGCMKYALQKAKKGRWDLVVRFATELTPQNAEGCLLQEKSSGEVEIDPASMQIRRLEITTPRHVMEDGSEYASAVVGRREITVEYAPVMLGGESFWMPSEITMRVVEDGGTFHPLVWWYRATYRKYHKTEVTSHVVYGDGGVR
ncbi:MAG: hypothetical protein WBY53_05375 [Acidobacteriaceae bacterium]